MRVLTIDSLAAFLRADRLRLVPSNRGDGAIAWTLTSDYRDSTNPDKFWPGYIIDCGTNGRWR